MESKQRRILLGCAAGCLIPVVLLIGSCVGFQRWLQAPAPVLEPQQLLDEQAVGFVEWRMELENPGTERFFDAAVNLLDVQARQMPSIPVFDLFMRWNQRRQVKQLRRVFPATGSWTLYPHGFQSKGSTEDTRPESMGQLYSLSISRMGNQLRMMDWLMGFTLSRAAEETLLPYRGERVYVFGPDGDEVSEEPEPGLEIETDRQRETSVVVRDVDELVAPVHIFLRREGAFLATEEAVAMRAVDHLEDEQAGASRGATDLERLFASVPAEYQLRGAVLNDNGELNEMLDGLVFGPLFEDYDAAAARREDGDVLDDVLTREELQALQRELRDAGSMVIGGAIAADGSTELDLTFAPMRGVDPEWQGALRSALEQIGSLAAERSTERGFSLDSTLENVGVDVAWRLRFADLAGDIEREVESLADSVRTEVRREVERVREQAEEADGGQTSGQTSGNG